MRRFLQFRLRSLLVAMTLLAIACAWAGSIFRERQADLQALAALQAGRVNVENATLAFQPYMLL